MCDYSLEMTTVRKERARVGENLVTTRFGLHDTAGFAEVANCRLPVCMVPGTRGLVSGLREDLRTRLGISVQPVEATFTQINSTTYRDALDFGNGHTILLMDLDAGICFDVVSVPGAEQHEETSAKTASVRSRVLVEA
jgi:hypothetical protein